MKMSEVFDLPIDYQGLYFGDQNGIPVHTHGADYKMDAASAHAINCHDELVGALELALSAIEIYAVDLKIPNDTIGQNKLRAALAKAKG